MARMAAKRLSCQSSVFIPRKYVSFSRKSVSVSSSFRSALVYRVRIVAVAASPLRGRGRVRIKSRDQHSRDLATLGPEVPLGHPTVNPLSYQENSSIRCKTESKAVAASPTRGRGRVRIKSRDQHLRDLATLGPGTPLGHPTVRTSPCVNIQVARHDVMLGAE